MADTAQRFSNHAKYDPAFHFFLVPLMGVNIVSALIHLIRHPGLGSFWWLILAIAGLVAVGRIRFYALRVQDRVIRLEERLRMMSVLPEPLRARIGELTDKQLIGLRFASDQELPGLVQRALDEKLSLADIKKSVTSWRPDYSRI
jgi:hypothetical protein